MGLGRKERAILTRALNQRILSHPLKTAVRLETRKPLSRYEPTNRWSREIDVMTEDHRTITLYEIKTTADTDAIGQLLLYRHILEKRIKIHKQTDLTILCEYVDDDILGVCADLDIKILTVNP